MSNRLFGNSASAVSLLALALNISAGIFLAVASKFHIELVLLAVAIIALSLALQTTSSNQNTLAELLEEAVKPESKGSLPIQFIVSDILRDLMPLGFCATLEDHRKLEASLLRGRYLRGHAFLSLLRDGSLNLQEELHYINDHPFPPFAEALWGNRPVHVPVVAINAVPDEYYTIEDLKRRIDFATQSGVDFYLVEPELARVSILIFDGYSALLYATPGGRQSCDFSEAILISESATIRELEKVFQAILALARKRQAGLGKRADVELRQIIMSRTS